MLKRTEVVLVNKQELRIVDGLLLVVGNHGSGKSSFLRAISENSRLTNYKSVSLLLDDEKSIANVLNVAFTSDWDTQYSKFVETHYNSETAKHILKVLPSANDLLCLSIDSLFAYKRLLLMNILLTVCIKSIMRD